MGGCPPRGMSVLKCLPRGVSAQGGCLPSGCVNKGVSSQSRGVADGNENGNVVSDLDLNPICAVPKRLSLSRGSL